MKKRLLAYLLCVSLVLGMLPGSLALPAKGAATDATDPKEEDIMVETDLHLEADGSGYYALDAQSPFYYIPFYTPSAVVGGIMGVMVLMILKRARVLDRFLAELER